MSRHSTFRKTRSLRFVVVAIACVMLFSLMLGHRTARSHATVGHPEPPIVSMRKSLHDLSQARMEIQQAARSLAESIPTAAVVVAGQNSPTQASATVQVGPLQLTVLRTSGPDESEQPPGAPSDVAQDPPTAETSTQEQPTATTASSGDGEDLQPATPATVATAPVEPATPDETATGAAEAATPVPAEAEMPQAATVAPSEEDMQKRREELAAHIGHWIQSLLNDNSGTASAPAEKAAQAVQSENGDVVVLQLSDEMVGNLLGEKGHALLNSFNSELPGTIRQTYALIPLSPPVDAAVTPVKPLLAAGGLRDIANSLVRLLDQADRRSGSSQGTGVSATTTVENQDSAVVVGVSPGSIATTDHGAGDRPRPTWIDQPDGRRIVAETEMLLPGDDPEQPLLTALNAALRIHLTSITASADSAIQDQVSHLHLQLDEATAKKCTVDTWEQVTVVPSDVAGPMKMRKVYALVEFPEAVDEAALATVRRTLQRDRVLAVAIATLFLWLAVCATGCSVRLGRSSSSVRRWLATPMAGLLAVGLLLVAVGILISQSVGGASRPDFFSTDALISVPVESAT